MFLHKTSVYPSHWNNVCYIMITVDRGSPCRLYDQRVAGENEHFSLQPIIRSSHVNDRKVRNEQFLGFFTVRKVVAAR